MENKNKPKDSDSILGKFPPLTPENIDIIEEEVKKDPTYGDEANEKELEDYFTSDNNALNVDRNIVLHKIFLIDYTNSTNLYRQKKKLTVFTLADRISKIKDLDKKIREGNIDIVNELAEQTYDLRQDDTESSEDYSLKEGKIILFSFASKYCLYHNRICYNGDAYSIYDRVVASAIPEYLKKTKKYSSERCRKNADYKTYHNYISEIIELYGLKGDGIRRKLDHFLWFPNKKAFYQKKESKNSFTPV